MKIKIIAIKENKLTFYALCVAIVCSFLVYAFSINSTVRYGVSHNKAEDTLSLLENKVSDLEYEYASRVNSLSIEYGEQMGLEMPREKTFISKSKTSGKSLSLSN